MVKFDPPGEPYFIVEGDWSLAPYNLISTLSARNMLKKGCQRFLALMKDVEAKEGRIEDTLVVNKFIDVFLEELLELPLVKEIKFCINLVPGM